VSTRLVRTLFRERSVLRRRSFRNVKVDTTSIRSVTENAVITTTLAIRSLSGELSGLTCRGGFLLQKELFPIALNRLRLAQLPSISHRSLPISIGKCHLSEMECQNREMETVIVRWKRRLSEMECQIVRWKRRLSEMECQIVRWKRRMSDRVRATVREYVECRYAQHGRICFLTRRNLSLQPRGAQSKPRHQGRRGNHSTGPISASKR